MSQKESEFEKLAEEDIIDKVQDCVYGMNLNVDGKEYAEILSQIKNSIWLRGEIRRAMRTLISSREKEIAEEVEKLPPYYVEDSGEKMISSSEVLKILNNK